MHSSNRSNINQPPQKKYNYNKDNNNFNTPSKNRFYNTSKPSNNFQFNTGYIVNKNSVYANKDQHNKNEYYHKKYEYNDHKDKYRKYNTYEHDTNNAKDKNYTGGVGEILKNTNERNDNIKPTKSYLESNLSNNNYYYSHRNYNNNNNNNKYRNNNYYKNKYPSSASNLHEKTNEIESSDNVTKPMFVNTKLNEQTDIKFAELKQEDDLFLKKMQQMENKDKEKETLEKPQFKLKAKTPQLEHQRGEIRFIQPPQLQQTKNDEQAYKEAYENEMIPDDIEIITVKKDNNTHRNYGGYTNRNKNYYNKQQQYDYYNGGNGYNSYRQSYQGNNYYYKRNNNRNYENEEYNYNDYGNENEEYYNENNQADYDKQYENENAEEYANKNKTQYKKHLKLNEQHKDKQQHQKQNEDIPEKDDSKEKKQFDKFATVQKEVSLTGNSLKEMLG